MKLYIMRHGQAQPIAQTDKQRSLTDTGREESINMAKWLALTESQFDLTFVSPYHRAQETFDLVSQEFEQAQQHLVLDELTPNSSPESCGDTLLAYCAQIKAKSALVVSHLPLVGLLVADLCAGSMMPSFATASIACIEIDLDSWQGELLWHKSHHELT
ncbi:phosphohistidine phosphatase SixA [Psychrobium sp. 1_MG-2023]|uniref:phosphohistidine phosphatase SixA n=1 Tax=Psychrobium sp. 1_MG-2023 TaxID=3062624 RepID=UPI000C33CFD2|nr:phosphohistidine phosphatase SixA [Psychrobium sp. 1_MG-2023]MDP2560183.1 phosphohistidine phosphatase SixA [Psychrobium sp. 1_MG-2023]PKF56994.1 phosphohistidine phosphatase SixA [Alteromonadales bacterium alter-6D02]